MPYSRPSLDDLINQATQDVVDAQITDPQTSNILVGLLQKAVLRVLPTVLAGLTYGEYGYVDWLSKMFVPWTAEDEYLYGWAALKAVYQKDATAATATFNIASGATNGTVLPAATIITRGDGAVYTTTAAETVSGGAISAPIVASVAGSAGTIVSGATLTIASPIDGIPPTGTGTPVTPGTDQETDDDLRTRMLLAYAAPPQGGDRADYVQWAEAVSGVTRAWVAPNQMGAGTVSVFFMMDDAESAFAGFPQGTNGVATNEPRDAAATGDQLTVANAIYDVQPVTALVYATAPTAMPTNFSITLVNNTAAVQAGAEAALTDMFLRLGNVGGTTDPTTGDAWDPIDPSDWYAALTAVSGIGRFVVNSPTSPISPSAGQLPTLGTCSWP